MSKLESPGRTVALVISFGLQRSLLPKNAPVVVRAKWFSAVSVLHLTFDKTIVDLGLDPFNWIVTIAGVRHRPTLRIPHGWNSFDMVCAVVGGPPGGQRVRYIPPPFNLEGIDGAPVQGFTFRNIEIA